MALSISRVPLRASIMIAAVVAVLDSWTKLWAEQHLDGYRSVEVFANHISLVLAKNRGGAWGLFQSSWDVRRWFYAVATVFALLVAVWFHRRLRIHQRPAAYGLGLILGSGIGATVDRLRHDYAVDFIDIHAAWGGVEHHWPMFNIGDVAALMGGLLFVVGVNAVPSFGGRLPRFWSFRSRRAAFGLALRTITLPFQLVVSRITAVVMLATIALFPAYSRDAGASSEPSVAGAIILMVFVAAFDFALVGAAFLLLARIWYQGRRMSQPTAQELRALDSRKPVLFLRAFFRDEQPITRRGAFWLWMPIGRSIASYVPATFEDGLVELLMWVGPPIALARPTETLAPAGAARTHVADDSWRKAVRSLAADAQLVVLVVDDTPAIRWEIKALHEGQDKSRLVLVLPPGGRHGRAKERPRAWYASWEDMRREFDFLPFVDDCVAAIRFTETGEARAVAAKSARAWDIVDAVERELEADVRRSQVARPDAGS